MFYLVDDNFSKYKLRILNGDCENLLSSNKIPLLPDLSSDPVSIFLEYKSVNLIKNRGFFFGFLYRRRHEINTRYWSNIDQAEKNFSRIKIVPLNYFKFSSVIRLLKYTMLKELLSKLLNYWSIFLFNPEIYYDKKLEVNNNNITLITNNIVDNVFSNPKRRFSASGPWTICHREGYLSTLGSHHLWILTDSPQCLNSIEPTGLPITLGQLFLEYKGEKD